MSWQSYHTNEITTLYLFKFLSTQWLIDFLNTGNIWFSRADKFGDKMECVTVEELQKPKPDFKAIEERKKRFLISCWHLANKESLAFWDTYTDPPENRRTFALKFKRKELVYLLKDNYHKNDRMYFLTQWMHGKVLYKDMVNVNATDLDNARIKYPAFRKEGAFKYESEYRFVIQCNQNYDELGFSYNIGMPQNLEFDILINPLLHKDEYNQLQDKVKEAGFGNHLKESIVAKWLRPDLW
jgi:hypothetical protein